MMMESIVIFNMGRDARRAGQPCEAPDSVMYPARSRYIADHDVEAALDSGMQQEWRRGWHWTAGATYSDCTKRERAA